ncbi:ATP-binding protein [Lentzea sp. NPDC051213]|uniref:ATP-binding protein n=1 Tax=Lentzea sp. NPDC051213 TaxID=3364126 RepID=UPI00379E497A
MSFVARKAELRAIEDLLRAAADGCGGALVVAGEPGMGKSALIDTATSDLDDWLVLRASGTEFERDLPYAALHQLCTPVLGHRTDLPLVQRQALESVFGLGGETAPNPLMIGLAVLGLLHELAQSRPVCCVVDDIQWIDAGSRQVLCFVARRVAAERIALVLAERSQATEPRVTDLPHLWLSGLDDADARVLLHSTPSSGLGDEVLARILAEAGGNPLALLEFRRSTGPLGLPGGDDRSRATVVDALEAQFARRVQALPPAVRSLVVLAAAEPVGDIGLVRRAAHLLDLDPAGLTAAEDEGLLTFGPRLRFRHPLVRSSAYNSATPGTRRRVHAALAEATDQDTDPDRRAWHRAHSVDDTDEEVAEELVRASARTQRRSGFAAASALVERAAELTPDPGDQGRRLLSAAKGRLQSGAPARARELLAEAERRPLRPRDRAEVRLQYALIDLHVARSPEATVALVDAAADLPPDSARKAYIEAFSSAMFIDRLPGRLRRLGARIRDQAPPPTEPRPVDLLLDALLAQVLLPVEEAVPAMRRAVAAFRTVSCPRWMELACMMALDLKDDESAQAISALQVRLAHEQGAYAVLSQALRFQALAKIMLGRYCEAAAHIEEACAVDEAVGTVSLAFGELILAAWRGDAGLVEELRNSLVERVGRAEVVAELYATAVLRNGLGDYAAALEALLTAQAQEQRGSYVVWGLDQELVEAAARTGRPEVAAAAMVRLEAVARVGRSLRAVGAYLVSQALLDPVSEDTEKHYREAIDVLALSEARVYYGRARLNYGEWLRREGRRAEARVELEAACDALTAAEASAFAERAARELLATGQRPRRDGTNPLDLLTARERLIVGKVAAGATSKEVAATLFLSPRTVDTHLRNIYRKLGVSSRRQLRELPL